VDLVPWVYVWRADRPVQSPPEACFIPRRLARLDRIYRTARETLAPDQLKSPFYDQRDLLETFPPAPAGRLHAGLLWSGGLRDYQLELSWPAGVDMPPPDTVEVRTYPTSFGWFGFTVDRVLAAPAIAADGRTWTYTSPAGQTMDSSYSQQVPAAAEMLAVFCRPNPSGASPPVPALRLTSAQVGRWRRARLRIERVRRPAPAGAAPRLRLEEFVARIESVEPLASDPDAGVVVTLLWAPDARPGFDSRLTLRLQPEAVTFAVRDLQSGPILLPRHGLYIAWAEETRTAAQFAAELAARGAASVRQRVAAHPEPASLAQLLAEVRLWTCSPGARLTPFPAVPESPMTVELADRGWTEAWRAAVHQLTGPHLWGGLAFEVARVTHAMELIGLHAHAEKVYAHFLRAPAAKSDGDYADGAGALEWAASMRHDMGYAHDGTHASTGRLLHSMAERVLLTGDLGWLRRHRVRLQAAADWIVRQRRTYLADVPERRALFVAGLMPPCMLGDYALPACDWHWYYVDNAFALQGLQRFGDALALLDPAAARPYQREAATFRRDLRRAFVAEAALAPVRLGQDGVYHSFVPRMAYARGLTGPELGAPQFPDCDWWLGSLPLVEPFVGIDPADPRMRDTTDLMEEMGTSAAAVGADEEARRAQGLCAADAWFYHSYAALPKASHTANAYLLQDDIPSFLRFWANHYAATVGADGKLWEHAHLGSFDTCTAPDNGTAGWFLECFRNALVMEDGTSLWLGRATPRAWLAHGARIAVAQAPTWFGPLAYEIESAAAEGRITATIRLPARTPPRSVLLRLRHPAAVPLRAVRVDGKRWRRFSPRREIVWLPGQRGTVVVEAFYGGAAAR